MSQLKMSRVKMSQVKASAEGPFRLRAIRSGIGACLIALGCWQPGAVWATEQSSNQMTLGQKVDAFVSQWTGVPVDFDQAYGFQCVDLVRRYATDVLGLNEEIPEGNAYSIFVKTRSPRFHKFTQPISQSGFASGVLEQAAPPEKGAIIFWHEAKENGGAGHVAIVVSASPKSFTSFDQNYCADSGTGLGKCAPRLIEHTYKNIAGWLFPLRP
jgi:CHAP domain